MGFLFASVFKRDNGVWYILYTHQGRQRWISTKTKQKAEALKRLKSFQEPRTDQPQLWMIVDSYIWVCGQERMRTGRGMVWQVMRGHCAIKR